MDGVTLWITGLPGSGKSTVADTIKKRHPGFIILRMDEFRKIVTPSPTYSDEERDIVYRALVFVAKKLSESGRDVIIDATGSLRKWRDIARQQIPRYMEIYLQCPIDICMQREKERRERHGAPEQIYEKGKTGWPVPGIAAPYEEPLAPEVLIKADEVSPADAMDAIEAGLKRIRSS